MGIKDWFGGEKAKKKEQLRDKVKQAVSDGKLSSSDLMEIKALEQELDVTPAADDKTEMRREIYNEAVGHAKDKGAISATGVHELAKIQKFLALRDDQVEKTRFQVTRLRTLTEVKAGNLPTVPDNSMALRDVTLEAGEIPHYVMQVDVLDQPMTRGQDGVALVSGQAYADGEAGGHGLPDNDAKEMGESTLIVSNRRLILKTRGRLAAIKLGPGAKIYLYGDGLRLERTVGNTLLKFKSGTGDTAEIIGELLAALMK